MVMSFDGVCCKLLHVAALIAAVWSAYLFLGTSFENVLTAFELLSVALALEAIAAVVGRVRKAAAKRQDVAPG